MDGLEDDCVLRLITMTYTMMREIARCDYAEMALSVVVS